MSAESDSNGTSDGPVHLDTTEAASPGVLATASLAGALVLSSCCIAPLLFVMLGISGAWISNLTALAPYQPFFLVATAGFLGMAFRKVYRKTDTACIEGSYCANPKSDLAIKTTLWLATILVVITTGINYLGPLFL